MKESGGHVRGRSAVLVSAPVVVLRAAVLLASLLALPGLHAQFCGRVIDASDERSVPGCIVLDANGKLLNDTDRDGRFCLSPPLPMAITIQAQGFHARRIELNGTLPDTLHLRPLRVDLSEVRITPDPQRSLGTAMITATTLDSSLLQGFERASINSAMQWVPGVQMDQRGHGGSTRLSIRGSLLRSPFGVRGVKVYWGGLPMTLADGSTPLELLDPEIVGTLQVVRSIGPPAYGSAPSGLLLVQPPWPTASSASQPQRVCPPTTMPWWWVPYTSATRASETRRAVLATRCSCYRVTNEVAPRCRRW